MGGEISENLLLSHGWTRMYTDKNHLAAKGAKIFYWENAEYGKAREAGILQELTEGTEIYWPRKGAKNF